MVIKISWVFLKTVYLPGLKNSVADALSRQPDLSGPCYIDIGDSCSEPYALYDPVSGAIKNWLKVLAIHLVLADCI